MAKSKKIKGLMRVLMVMSYKDNPIVVRMIGKDMFLWDVVINSQFYSSYIIMKPSKDKKVLDEAEISEVVKICYAGAATTVDNILGVELPKTDENMASLLEGAERNFKKGEA